MPTNIILGHPRQNGGAPDIQRRRMSQTDVCTGDDSSSVTKETKAFRQSGNDLTADGGHTFVVALELTPITKLPRAIQMHRQDLRHRNIVGAGKD